MSSLRDLLDTARKVGQGLITDATPLSEARLAICQACPHLEPGLPRTCGLCGCIVRLKVKVETEHCPKGRW